MTQIEETQQQNQQLEQQLALARRQLEAVQRVSTALYSVTDTDTLLRQALGTALDVVGADAGSILLYNADRNVLVFRSVIGPVSDTLTGTTIDLALGKGIAGEVFRTGLSRITPNVDTDVDHVGTIDARTGYHTRSLMTVPLNARRGPALGVMQFVNKRIGEFDSGDVAVSEIVSSLVTMSLQNSLLAREANLAAIARSVGEISHDIGNMLTHVLPYVQSLEGCIVDVRNGKPGSIDTLETFYEEVKENVAEGVDRVTARTREMASALKGEIAPLVFKPGRPYETAERVVKGLAAAASRVDVHLSTQGDPLLEAVYDGPRLYNALYNLANNALPETPPGGSITLTIHADPDPAFYTIEVADTGKGMPEEVRKMLFTDGAYSTKTGGTGLGTRIVRRIVEQHGGKASVRSVLGEGTKITLRLPRVL